MATVIGVRFKKAGKVYYFDPNGLWPKPGENVVVETARGVEYGEAVTEPTHGGRCAGRSAAEKGRANRDGGGHAPRGTERTA